MTPQQIDAMKLALEALNANYLLVNGTETHGGLEQCLDGYYSSCFDTDPINKQTEEAITAIKEALAEHAMREAQRLGQEIEQESVAYPDGDVVGPCICGSWPGGKCLKCPRITTPPQRKPLTNGEIYTAYITATNQMLRAQDERLAFAFARAIEAAHGIKENT